MIYAKTNIIKGQIISVISVNLVVTYALIDTHALNVFQHIIYTLPNIVFKFLINVFNLTTPKWNVRSAIMASIFIWDSVNLAQLKVEQYIIYYIIGIQMRRIVSHRLLHCFSFGY